jgi:NAD-dependent SIR2 family protein deacetylase
VASFSTSYRFLAVYLLVYEHAGAGISVQAGIPDFRSSDGLFQTLKRDNPREALCSGKDLFDASVFNVSILLE